MACSRFTISPSFAFGFFSLLRGVACPLTFAKLAAAALCGGAGRSGFSRGTGGGAGDVDGGGGAGDATCGGGCAATLRPRSDDELSGDAFGGRGFGEGALRSRVVCARERSDLGAVALPGEGPMRWEDARSRVGESGAVGAGRKGCGESAGG